MESEFKLMSELKDDVLIMHTSGYVNNDGGEKIAQEFSQHFNTGIKKLTGHISIILAFVQNLMSGKHFQSALSLQS